MKKISFLAIVLLWLIITILGIKQFWRENSSLTLVTPQKNEYMVKRVIDGDTIELEGGQRVRYIGINTPETVDPRKPVECFGQQAKEANKKLVEGKKVKLEKDVSETDKYQRLLRYVYIDKIFVNEYLVKEGFAQVATFPPDVKYVEVFLKAQKEAKINNKGLWSACPLKK